MRAERGRAGSRRAGARPPSERGAGARGGPCRAGPGRAAGAVGPVGALLASLPSPPFLGSRPPGAAGGRDSARAASGFPGSPGRRAGQLAAGREAAAAPGGRHELRGGTRAQPSRAAELPGTGGSGPRWGSPGGLRCPLWWAQVGHEASGPRGSPRPLPGVLVARRSVGREDLEPRRWLWVERNRGRKKKKIKAEHPKDVFIWARRARGGGLRWGACSLRCFRVRWSSSSTRSGLAGGWGCRGCRAFSGWCSVKQDFGYFQEQSGSVGMGLQRAPGAAGLKRLSPCLGVKAAARGLSFSPHASHPPCCLTALFLKRCVRADCRLRVILSSFDDLKFSQAHSVHCC